MKFHRIDVKNINSLFGEHPIDIDGKFADTPLYLIMGPTGSGKTTILDAVCLALFGTTPRQEGADGGAAGVGAQVNSRGTGRSRARVVFSLLDADQAKRTRYQATWEFWRAHDRPDGTPQTPRRELHQLGDDGEWKVIVSSTKEKEYQEAFDRVLDGMTLQDFLRSVMLAQGEFSALLKAGDEEKASILERLTDTGDYQKLGWLAHRRWQIERDKLDGLKEQIKNFEGASPEQITAAEAALGDQRTTCASLVEWREATVLRRGWLEQHGRFKRDLDKAKEALAEAKTKKEAHADDFASRDADRSAAPARAQFEKVRRLEADQQTLEDKLPDLEENKEKQRKALEEAKAAEKAAAKELEGAEETLKELKPAIDEAKNIKNDLKNVAKQVEELGDKAKEQQKVLEKATEAHKAAKRELDEAKSAYQDAVDAFKTVAGVEDPDEAEQADDEQTRLSDAKLARKRFEVINEAALVAGRKKEALDTFAERIDEFEEKQRARDVLSEAREEVVEKIAAHDEAVEALEAEREQNNETLDELKAEIERLGQNLLAAELRRNLREGEACPVCGGEEHPRIDHYDQETLASHERRDEQERLRLVARVEACQDKLTKLDENLKAKADAKQELSKTLTRLDTKLESADEALAKLEREITELSETTGGRIASLDWKQEDVDEALSLSALAIEEELQALEDQKQALADAQDALVVAEKAFDAAEKAFTQAKSSQENAKENLETTSKELGEKREQVKALEEALAEKLDGKDPDEVEKDHTNAIERARRAKDKQVEARQETEKAAQKASDDLERATKRRAELVDELKTASAKLEEAIAAIDGISSVEEVGAALLEDAERKRLDELCGAIETALRDAGRDIERLEGEIKKLDERKPADFSPEEYALETLQACERQLDEAIAAYNQKIGALEQKLEQMRERLDQFRDLVEARDAQQQEYDGWKELNDIIGVRNGERFKQFAQALNLDRIVERANRRLTELHPRYRLKTKRDKDSGLPTLDFEIVDTYHAGRPRDLSTLSGGETFLVSLALALALADQQKIKMPIETLFLDEGFGTLDKDSLRKAIDILKDLHTRAGRTVGVISHVEALQERITSQIIVKPEQEGRSTVTLEQG